MTESSFFATVPKALESLLAQELSVLGAREVVPGVAGVAFRGDLATAYRVCLWSRLANHVLLQLAEFPVADAEDLYHGVQTIDWREHVAPEGRLAVHATLKRHATLQHSHFVALKTKDAIVDQLRARCGVRPLVDTEHPDVIVHVHVAAQRAQVSLDLAGDSLHRRGYRTTRVPAPIKENLASALLLLADWPAIAAQGGTLLDPMCGSGTLLLEGLMIAADYAPGLLREGFGFLRWRQHDERLWQNLRDEARQRLAAGQRRVPKCIGFDHDRLALQAATQHLLRLGLPHAVHFERRAITEARPAAAWPPGLIACNPPYGERLEDRQTVSALYEQCGAVLQQQFSGWQAAFLIGDAELGFRFGIRSQKPITLYNGALACVLLRFAIEPQAFFEPKPLTDEARLAQQLRKLREIPLSTGAEMVANRLRKNQKALAAWREQNAITCYRLYDADLPEYALAVDCYHGERLWVHVQEYAAPKTIDPDKAAQRRLEALHAVMTVLQVPPEQLFFKLRQPQKQRAQYEKLAEHGHFHIVEEGGCRFWVNFEDYLDTGLFLDHRPLRLLLQQTARGKRFLNLFGYTGTATVHAAKGGARATVTVDLSATYLDWARRNLELNGLRGAHELIQADCLAWLAQQARAPRQRFDVIFLDPPTFSNSKRMAEHFDVQRDHVRLIRQACALLVPEGVLYFSTNYRRFQLDQPALATLRCEDISAQTLPKDFARNAKIHYCWKIQPI